MAEEKDKVQDQEVLETKEETKVVEAEQEVDTVETDIDQETSEENKGEGKEEDYKSLYSASTKEALKLKQENDELKQYAALGAIAKQLADKDENVAKRLKDYIDKVEAGEDPFKEAEALDKAVEKAEDKKDKDTKFDLPPELAEIVEERKKAKQEAEEKRNKEVEELTSVVTEIEKENEKLKNSSPQVKGAVASLAAHYYKSGVTMKEAFEKAVTVVVNNGVDEVQNEMEKQELEKSVSGSVTVSHSTGQASNAKLEKAIKNMVAITKGKVSAERARVILTELPEQIEEYLD